MSVLDVLSGLATAAGKGYEGYANDQAQGVKDAAAEAKAAQDAERNRILNLISQRDLARLAPGDPGYGTYKAGEIGATAPATAAAGALSARALIQPGVEKINADAQPTATAEALKAAAVSPITTQTAVNTERQTAPIKTAQAIATAKGTSEFAAPIATQDDPGNPASPVTYKTRSQALGTGKAPAGGGAGGGGGGQGSQAPLDDMIQQYDRIAGHAKDVAAGTFKIGTGNATRSALGFGQSYAQAEGKPAIGAQLGQGAMDLFGIAPASDPTQMRYEQLMASTRAMGDDAAKVFKGRQGFQNIALEIAQSTLKPSDVGNPTIVEQKLSRLRNIIKLASIVSPAQAQAVSPQDAARFGMPAGTPAASTAAPAAGGSLPPISKVGYDALLKAGYNDDEVRAKYTVQP